jgi:arylsulfatase
VRAGVVLVGLLSLAAPACAPRPEPGWLHLATLEADEVRAPRADFALAGGRRITRLREDGRTWLELELAASDWSAAPEVPGLWRAALPVHGRGAPGGGDAPAGLAAGERRFRYASPLAPGPPAPGSFRPGSEGSLLLRLGPGETPPAAARLLLFVSDARGGRLSGDRFSGEAISVLPGEVRELVAAVPPGAALRFATALEPALVGGGRPRGAVSFQVRADGHLVFEHRETDPGRAAFAWHAVPLPRGDRVHLRFAVEGALAHTAFFVPVVGPARLPARRRPPDLLLFLADTFRADNLAAYGSTLGLTPALDRIAQRSLLFRRAWSPATYTMAAHAALFSGLYARQAGATSSTAGLPQGLETIAERLARAGYRTGAVTDSAVVSDRYGLSQGFEWFDEEQETLASTCARALAFLDADDGRPVFLFVQSYRVHTPYRASEGAGRDSLPAYRELQARFAELAREPVAVRRASAERRRVVEALRELYRGAVADFDRDFGAFHASLERRGFFERGVLVFTSDHGEAFAEHDHVYHDGPVWEELTRIPLFLRGAGIDAGTHDAAASLVDLAPTLAALAGVPPDPEWPGRPLLGEVGDRPVFLFENRDLPTARLGIVEAERKLLVREDPDALARGESLAAYDLARDPGEHAPHAEAEWARELLARHAAQAAELLRPRVEGVPAALDERKVEELRALGYLE